MDCYFLKRVHPNKGNDGSNAFKNARPKAFDTEVDTYSVDIQPLSHKKYKR